MKHLPLLLLLGAAPYLAAETAVSPESLREGEAKQQQLRGEAQRLVAQLDGMIGEYERNGLRGDESKAIQGLRDTLDKLSVDEMRSIVELLEKARGAANAGEAKQRVSDAYAGQKAIIGQLQKLLAEHLRNQRAQELSAQVAKLAERQAGNLQNGITLGQWAGGKKPENFEAALQANLQGQRAEQLAIAEELRIAAQRVAMFAKDPENGAMAERLQKGLEAIAQLQPKVDSAAEALRDGQLFKAVENEKISRDGLRRLARELAPPQNRADALRTAQKELEKAIEDQRNVANDVAKAAGEQDFDRWLDKQIAGKTLDRRLQESPREQLRRNADLQRAFLAQKDGRADELVAAENKQGDFAGKSDELAQALAKEAPAAAQDLRGGVDKMQDARGAMMDRNAPAAAASGRQALAALEAAEAKLQQEIAKADALAGQPADAQKNPAAPNPAAQAKAAGQLAQAQEALQQAEQSLQQAQQAQAAGGEVAAKQAAQQAAEQLAQAAAQAGQVATQGAAGNDAAQQAAQSGAEAAKQGATQAGGQNIPGAQAQVAAAQKALAQAQMALAQAQSGVTAAQAPASPGAPGEPGNQPGQPGAQPGQPGQASQQPGPMPGAGGAQAAQDVPPAGNEAVQVGARAVANRKALFTALPARERAVIEQAQTEKYPEEYSAQIEQYLLNLARESAAKK